MIFAYELEQIDRLQKGRYLQHQREQLEDDYSDESDADSVAEDGR